MQQLGIGFVNPDHETENGVSHEADPMRNRVSPKLRFAFSVTMCAGW
jgi:hypothetical protein